MIVFVRFQTDIGIDPWAVEAAVQGAVGKAGVVVGASADAVDVEVSNPDDVDIILGALAEALRESGMPPTTQLDIPAAGRRLGIYDF